MNGGSAEKLLLEQALIGRVITQVTSIERIIGAYLADFYTRRPAADYQTSYLAFTYDIMNDQGISLNTKINILFKIHQRLYGVANKPSRSLFDKWVNIRNIFAHGTYIVDRGILYGGVFYDVNELADKHAELQTRLNAEFEKFKELQGPYFNQFPTKEWTKK